MKLVLSVVNDEDAFQLVDALNEAGFAVTKLASTGGFLRTGNTTLICGVDEDKVPALTHIIEQKCRSRKQITSVNSAQPGSVDSYVPYPVEVTVGGATVFVLDVDQFIKI